MSLREKVTLITGGSGGLGRTVSEVFAKTGSDVILAQRDEPTALLDAVPGLSFVATDVTDETSVRRMVETIKQGHGRIDVLLCLVGGFAGGKPVADTDVDDFERMVNLNLRSVFLCAKYVFPLMKAKKWGRIVTVGARPVVHPVAGIGAYSATKAGVVNLTQVLALEGKEYGITANSVLPSVIDTPSNREGMPDADASKWVTPQSLAETLMFLCSDSAADVSGGAIPVYGQS